MKMLVNYGGFDVLDWFWSNNVFVQVDFYIFMLVGGYQVCYNSIGYNFMLGDDIFKGGDVEFECGSICIVVGFEVDMFDLMVYVKLEYLFNG